MPVHTLKGFPLSLQQARLYTLEEDIQTYRVLGRVLLEGVLDPEILQQAFKRIIAQYSILRTRFYCPPGMDVPMQIVSSQVEMLYEEFDLSQLDRKQQDTQLDAHFVEMRSRPFDLEHGPLLHVTLARTGALAHQLFLCLPGLCADAVTLRLLLRELGQTYETHLRGEDSTTEQVLQYTEVSAWQNDLLEEEDAVEPLAYWSQIDLSKLHTQPLPFLPGRTIQSESEVQKAEKLAAQGFTFGLTEEIMRQLQQFSQHNACSYESVLLTIWQIALSRLTGEPDLLIGVTCDGRMYEELETIPGHCARVVPLATYCRSDRTFSQNVVAMRAILEQAREQQLYFSWRRQEALEGIDTRYFPLAFEYVEQTETWKTETISYCYLEEYSHLECAGLKLRVVQASGTYQLELQYDPTCFSARQIERLADTVLMLLESALARLADPVDRLELVNRVERQRLLQHWIGPHDDFAFQPLTWLFEEIARLTPSATAVISDGESLTYGELNQQANRLARWLQKRGVGPDVLVGLYVERGIDMLLGLLGILKAGGAYVPLDPSLPSARLKQQLTQIESSVLLTQQSLLGQLPAYTGCLFCLDCASELLTEEMNTNLATTIEPEHLAYVIYTSGSTGLPKGVAIRQQGISNYVQDMCQRLNSDKGLHFATVSTLAADLGNTTIFCSLATGGCLHILPYTVVTSSEAFASYIDEHPIDVLKIVPSHFSALLTGGQGQRILPRKYLILGGEALSWELIERLRITGCTCKVWNHYGPTEATIGVLVNELSTLERGREETTSVSLGRPIANMRFLIVDQFHMPVPVGIPGELWLSGAGLAAGYLGNPELTDQQFPLYSCESTPQRFYRTGDRVRYTEQGQLEFLGRLDRQIKIRGYRIEPGDIEAVFKQHVAVRESMVLLQEDTPGEQKLAAYVLIAREYTQTMPDLAEFRRFLSEKLPVYMHPTVIVPLAEWPLTANGKIDYQRLKTLKPHSPKKSVVAPRDQVEFKLMHIWENLLHVWPVSITDNFFELGGHSILAVALIAQIQRAFGHDLPVTTLFQYPTIEKLATVLRHYTDTNTWQTIVPIQTNGSRPPLFCVHPSGGTAFCYYTLARCLGPDQPVYGIQAPDPTVWEQNSFSVVELATQYIAALRQAQAQGPYFLGGWSAGGVIAFEMACQLRRQGERVALLALFDSSAPLGQREPLAPPDLRDPELARSILEELQLAPSPLALNTLQEDERLPYVLEQAKIQQRVPQDISLAHLRYFAHMQKKLLHALRSYTPAVYPGRITLFRTPTSAALESQHVSAPAEVGANNALDRWAEFSISELELHIVPGEHATLMNEPDVIALADILSRILTQMTVE
ncbi:non-ribosomal peptide synthetase [Ktedonobacter robiniae]|uniref:Carrier domain-containing protein n=1 Tax=Ktedonobacter robiniae TaxID=2778365 RepID=A0ABQ3UZ49_9CHLR|nr:non-ribosomal peptide synthetase [Ktedonobacter robiniae]GHO57937.1 hypothetical protein KSB_64120 [Ktedonobacter robiniae]